MYKLSLMNISLLLVPYILTLKQNQYMKYKTIRRYLQKEILFFFAIELLESVNYYTFAFAELLKWSRTYSLNFCVNAKIRRPSSLFIEKRNET